MGHQVLLSSLSKAKESQNMDTAPGEGLETGDESRTEEEAGGHGGHG